MGQLAVSFFNRLPGTNLPFAPKLCPGGLADPETPATRAHLNNPLGMALTGTGSVLIADMASNRVRTVSSYYLRPRLRHTFTR